MGVFEKQYWWCIRPKKLVTSMYKLKCYFMGKYKQHAHSLEKVLELYLRQPLQLWSHLSHNHLRYDQEIIVILRESFDQEIASSQLSNTKSMPWDSQKGNLYLLYDNREDCV